MPERATVHQVVQIGPEVTPGTPVAADVKLQAISIEPSIQADITTIRPMGGKFPTQTALGREWVGGRLSGQAAYDDLAYILASLLTNPTPVLEGSVDGWSRTFTPSQGSPDSNVTYTVEFGSSVRAARFSYGLVTSLGLNFTRQSVEVSGAILGQQLDDGITMTASPTELDVVPVLPTDVCVYMDTDYASLGTTKLTRALQANLQIGDRFSALWTLDCDVDGYAAHVERVPTSSLQLMVEADAAGMALLDYMRAASKVYVRIEATGPEIEAGTNYRLTIDLACSVSAVSEFRDHEGVYAIQWTLQPVHDADWGQALQIELVNNVATL